MRLPDYFDAIKEQDLEEFVEEERTYSNEFRINNISPDQLAKAEEALNARRQGASLDPEGVSLFGEPYYQPIKVFENWLHFNCSSNREERSIKLLLNLPMIPPNKQASVKLQHQ